MSSSYLVNTLISEPLPFVATQSSKLVLSKLVSLFQGRLVSTLKFSSVQTVFLSNARKKQFTIITNKMTLSNQGFIATS